MSVLTYSGITIPYSYTTSFKQEVLYEPYSGTDWFCTRFDIQVQGVINLAYIDVIAPNYAAISAPDNAAQIMNAIRTDLLKPRKALSFKVNEVEMIPAATANAGSLPSGTVDVQNGPKPVSCIIHQLTSVTFIISYHIIAHYWENNEVDGDSLDITNRTGNPVLFNKWTETVEIDNCLMSRRIREGKYVIRSDNNLGRTVDKFRSNMAVVGVPSGFLRESANYKVSPDGLGLEYRIIDKEVYKMPPKLAYEADGWYKQTSTRMAAKRYGEVYVKLKGAKDVGLSPQTTLVEIALAIAARKIQLNSTTSFSEITVPVGSFIGGILGYIAGVLAGGAIGSFGFNPLTIFAGAAAGGTAGAVAGSKLFGSTETKTITKKNILEFATVKVDMYKNEVEVHMKFLLTGSPYRKAGVTGFTGSFCHTPFSEDGAKPPDYFDRGTASLLLSAAAYYDPSLNPNNLVSDTDKPEASTDNPRTEIIGHNQLEFGKQVGEIGINPE